MKNAARIAKITTELEMDHIFSIGKVSYLSGGIGSDSREAFAARENEFNLKLASTITGAGAANDYRALRQALDLAQGIRGLT